MKTCPLCNNTLIHSAPIDYCDKIASYDTKGGNNGQNINYFHYGEAEDGWIVHLPPYRIFTNTTDNVSLIELFDFYTLTFDTIHRLSAILRLDSEDKMRQRIETLFPFL